MNSSTNYLTLLLKLKYRLAPLSGKPFSLYYRINPIILYVEKLINVFLDTTRDFHYPPDMQRRLLFVPETSQRWNNKYHNRRFHLVFLHYSGCKHNAKMA
jgi:hypothetical protein